MLEMKGPGELIAVVWTETFRLELIRFLDHSLAIFRQGVSLALFEPEHAAECWRSFYQLSRKTADEPIHVIVTNRTSPERFPSSSFSPQHMN